MTSARVRNAAQTRADILRAARARFGSDGYDRTTIRTQDVGTGLGGVADACGSHGTRISHQLLT